MSHDPSYEVFMRWNEAAAAELDVRIRGPLLSVPGRLHYLISDLGAGQERAPSVQSSQVGYRKPAIPDYPASFDFLQGPSDHVLTKSLGCTLKKRGRLTGWMYPQGLKCRDMHQIVTEDWWPIVAPGLLWETAWAQYWFNRHHHLSPRWVPYGPDSPWSELADAAYNPAGSLPYRELYIHDKDKRPNFGLTDALAGKLLDLTARIKGDVIDDGLRYPPESLPKDVQRIRAETKERWSPADFAKPRREN